MLNRHKQHVLDYVQLRPGLIVIYPDLQRSGRSSNSLNWLDIIEGNSPPTSHPKSIINATYTGEFTDYSRKKFTKATDALFEIVPWRKVFNPVIKTWQNFHLSITTLTLSARPEHLTNAYVTKNLLNHWLTTMRRSKGLRYYVWKAELQDNLNIHYHVLSDLFLPHNEVRNIWNAIQSKAGIIQEFKDKHGHTDPNSTDIHTVSSYDNIRDYLRKYATKKATNEKFNSLSPDQQKPYKIPKVWDCSSNLTNIGYPTEFTDNSLMDWLERELTSGRLIQKEDSFFTIIHPPRSTPKINYPDFLKRRIKSHYHQFRKVS